MTKKQPFYGLDLKEQSIKEYMEQALAVSNNKKNLPAFCGLRPQPDKRRRPAAARQDLYEVFATAQNLLH